VIEVALPLHHSSTIQSIDSPQSHDQPTFLSSMCILDPWRILFRPSRIPSSSTTRPLASVPDTFAPSFHRFQLAPTTFKVVVNTSQVLFRWILKPARRTRSNVTRQTRQHLLTMAVLIHLPRRLSSASLVNVFYAFEPTPSSNYAIALLLS